MFTGWLSSRPAASGWKTGRRPGESPNSEALGAIVSQSACRGMARVRSFPDPVRVYSVFRNSEGAEGDLDALPFKYTGHESRAASALRPHRSTAAPRGPLIVSGRMRLTHLQGLRRLTV